MATGALDANGIWQYGEDDSNTTFSALLNRLGTSIGSNMKGRILQVVLNNTNTGVTNTTSTWAATGLTATITPLKSTSKILVLGSVNGLGKGVGGNINNSEQVEIRRNSTSLLYYGEIALNPAAANYNLGFSAPFTIWDNPATTSATTYSAWFRTPYAGSSVYAQNGYSNSQIVLIEVSQ